jgi:hypothetical protein
MATELGLPDLDGANRRADRLALDMVALNSGFGRKSPQPGLKMARLAKLEPQERVRDQ